MCIKYAVITQANATCISNLAPFDSPPFPDLQAQKQQGFRVEAGAKAARTGERGGKACEDSSLFQILQK